MQIGEVNVGGMGSEQVAQVLRKADQHVKLIISRMVPATSNEIPIVNEVNMLVMYYIYYCATNVL